MKLFFFTFMLSLLQLSCQKSDSWQSADWRGRGAPPSVPTQFQAQETNFKTQDKEVEFSQLEVMDVPIEGAYLKKIKGQDGLEFVSYRVPEGSLFSLKYQINLMRTQKERATSEIKKYLKDNRTAEKVISEPHLLVIAIPQFQVIWRVFTEDSEGKVKAYDFNLLIQLLKEKPVGSGVEGVAATIYPQGPLRSQLQTVVFSNLLSSKNLVSQLIRISTRGASEAVSENNQFHYNVEDSRFFQVQAYHYVNKAFDWFNQIFQYSNPFQVEVEVSVGFPEKINTAFYFDKKIRLGDGDDLIYSKIPLDPSVVIHESIHSIIQAVSGLPFEKQGGSLNEAYADFFTACILNNPNLAEASYKKAAFKRTVANSMTKDEVQGGLYHDSGIISGLLWSLKTELGSSIGQKLAWNILLRMGPQSDFESFKTELLDLLSKEDLKNQKKAQKILTERGWMR